MTGSEALVDMKPAFVSGLSAVTMEIPDLPPTEPTEATENNSPIVKSKTSTEVDLTPVPF